MLWDVDLLYEQKSGARWCPEVIIPWIDQPFFNSTLVHENFFPSTGISRKFELFFFFLLNFRPTQNCMILNFVFGRHWSTWPTWILNTWRIWCYSVLHMNVWSVKMTLKGGALPCFSLRNRLKKKEPTDGWVILLVVCRFSLSNGVWSKRLVLVALFFLGGVSCPKTKWFGRFFWSSLFWFFEWSTWGKIIFSSNICRTRGRSEGCFFGQDIPENERQVQQVHLKNHYQSKSGKSSSNPKASTLASKRLPSRGS